MPQPPQAQSTSEPKERIQHRESPEWYWPVVEIRGLIAFGVVALGAIVFASFYFTQPSDKVTFLTVNILALIVLIFGIISAINTRKQWEIMFHQHAEMARQRKLMKEALERTDSLLGQNERIITKMGDQEARMIEQREIMERQWEAMKASHKQAQRFFDATERPSLGLGAELVWNQDPVELGAHVDVVIRNSGKSHAVKILSEVISGMVIFPDGYSRTDGCPEPERGPLIGLQSQGVIPIGGQIYLASQRLTQRDFTEVIKVNRQFFIWIYVTYVKSPQQRKPYIFETYSRWDKDLGAFYNCDIHNNAT